MHLPTLDTSTVLPWTCPINRGPGWPFEFINLNRIQESMASSKIFLASLLLFVLAIHEVESHRLLESHKVAEETVEESLLNESAAATGINCAALCAVRCSKSSRPNLCKRACGTCCFRCNCVPPGTYGNYNTCPCYASQTTRGGARKCP